MLARLTSTLVALTLLVGASATATARPAADASSVAALTTTSSKATTVLAGLPVKGKAARTGYSRDEFGPAWKDIDKNGCDTRNDVLARDLTKVKLKPGTQGCVVASGSLKDPYTQRTISFVRGATTSAAVQIDHVVPLANAWVTGGQKLTSATRTRFANDPLNLLAVDGPTNGAKGAGDAATWLPKNKAYRCTYVALQISVKAKYRLWVTTAEKKAMGRVLEACPKQTTFASSIAAPKKSAAKPVARIGTIKGVKVASGKKASIKPVVTTTGAVKLTSKLLTVTRSGKTVAKAVRSVKLGAGTYKVTTTVKYKVKSGTRWTAKTVKRTQKLVITTTKAAATASPDASGGCPSSAPIKGNRGSKEWIYHVPGGAYYKVTKAEECFATTAGATKAGYRASKR